MKIPVEIVECLKENINVLLTAINEPANINVKKWNMSFKEYLITISVVDPEIVFDALQEKKKESGRLLISYKKMLI